jgi:MoxR-like ATPase
MRNGKPLILDEFDAHSPAVRCLLQQVCDDPEICQVTLPDGEVVKPASGFCVVATSNLDPSKLHPALADRFDIRLNTYSPNAEVFAAFPEGIANQLRNLYGTATETTRELSLRAALSFKRLTAVGIDPELAARAVFGTAGLEWLQLASI